MFINIQHVFNVEPPLPGAGHLLVMDRANFVFKALARHLAPRLTGLTEEESVRHGADHILLRLQPGQDLLVRGL